MKTKPTKQCKLCKHFDLYNYVFTVECYCCKRYNDDRFEKRNIKLCKTCKHPNNCVEGCKVEAKDENKS